MIALGPFGLERPIAKGGMGQVWAGRHLVLDYPVAVKFLTAKAHRNRAYREAFRNEVRAVAALDHQNIVRIFDNGEATALTEDETAGAIPAGTPWLAMELVEGGTLSDWCGRLPWAPVETLILALLDALAHAHAHGVIHRDLKPSNVLVTGSRHSLRLKLTDFGLAQNVGTGPNPIGGGTPAYMAPEQFEGRWRDFGPWTDLYAAGCLFYALIKATPPFGVQQPADKQRQAHMLRPPPPLEAPYGVPEHFEQWLGRLLEKDPAKRFRRAADAENALRRLGPLIPPTGLVAVPEADDGPDRGNSDAATQPLDLREPVDTRLTLGALHDEVPTVPLDDRAPEGVDPGQDAPLAGLGLYGLRAFPLVGRKEERKALWEALRQTVDEGEVRVVVLSGAEGSGKSRLAEWLVHRSHEVGATEGLRATHGPLPYPHHGIAAMFRSTLRCQGLERNEVYERVSAVVRDADLDEVGAITEFFHPADAGSGVFGTATERYVTARRLLERMARERAVIVWLDDVHYGLDALRFALYLVERGLEAKGRLPLLLLLTVTDEILTARPDEAMATAELLEHDRSRQITVGDLPLSERPELVRGLLSLTPSLAVEVEARTKGNPLFAVQLVGDWIRRGAVEPGPAGFQLRASEVLPDDIDAMWAARVERLLAHRTPEEGHALELAAILGLDVDMLEWGDACVLAGSAHPSDELLRDLVDQGLVVCGPEGPVDGFRFSHRSLRKCLEVRADVGGRGRKWHSTCADVLSVSSQRPQGLSERIGRHHLGAGDFERALSPLFDGARERLITGDHALAEHVLSQREDALRQLLVPQTDVRWGEGWLLRHDIANAQGNYVETARWLHQIEEAANENGWSRIINRVRCLRGRRDRVQGRFTEAFSQLMEVERAAARAGDRPLMAESRLEIGRALLGSGDVPGAEKWSRLALQEYQVQVDPLGAGDALLTLGEAAKEAGRHGEATKFLRHAEALFTDGGHRFRMAAAVNGQGDVARVKGDLDKAMSLYRRSRGVLKAIGSKAWVFPEYNTGLVYLARGDHRRAQTMFEIAMAVFIEQGNSAALANAHVALALCSAHDEQWLLMEDHLTEAEGLLIQTGFCDDDTARLATETGATAMQLQQPGRAVRAYEVALRLWSGLGRKPETTKIESLLSELYRS